MKELKDYFVSHSQAVSLKELGFDKPCLTHYNNFGDFNFGDFYISPNPTNTNAPLIAQAIDWLTSELGMSVVYIDNAIESLKALRKKVTVTVTLTFEVYQFSKTYEDGNYLIILEDEYYPISVAIVYGQMIDSNGSSYDDEDVALISPSFEVIK